MNTRAASEQPPQAEPALRAIAMPADANPHGDIFGGWLLSQMDLAGGTAATRRARGRTATVAITAMTFHRPVFIGDEVTCYAEIIKVGNTSITVKVESWVRRGTGEEHIAVTEEHFHLRRRRLRSPAALGATGRVTAQFFSPAFRSPSINRERSAGFA